MSDLLYMLRIARALLIVRVGILVAIMIVCQS